MRLPVTLALCCLLGLATAAVGEGGEQQQQQQQQPPPPPPPPPPAVPGASRVSPPLVLQRRVASGVAIKPGTELRILCAGDSITLGTMSDSNGGDGNGYRLQLRNNLSKDRVVFAGTVRTAAGTMSDGYFAAWPGKTIEYISQHIGPSLQQRPNLILLHAGTNDMNPDRAISTEGNDPSQAAARLGALIDRMVEACPDAVILVAIIVGTCNPAQATATQEFQGLIPGVVQQRRDRGHHVLAANMSSFPTSELRDCVHPTNRGYRLLGDYWHDMTAQIPRDWIQAPVVPAPKRASDTWRTSTGTDVDVPLALVKMVSLAALTVLVGSTGRY